MRRFVLAALAVAFATNAFAGVTGWVFSEEGKPLRAKVEVYRVEDRAPRELRWLGGTERKPLAATTAGEDGAFTVDGTFSGVLELRVTHDGYAPERSLILAGDVAPAIALTVTPSRTLRVTANGKPVAKARVYAFDMYRFSDTDLGTTNDAGELAVPNPKRWAPVLMIVHPDYAPFTLTVERADTPLTAALQPGLTMAGTVTTAVGKPAGDALLFVNGWPMGRTKEDGTFSIAHVPAAATKIAATLPNAYGSAAAKPAGTAIQLAAGRTITGTVADSDGHPIAGLPVAATVSTEGPDMEVSYLLTVTDEKGRFRFDDARATQYGIWSSPVGDLDAGSAKADLRRTTAITADVNVTRSPMLRGIVRDARKKPVAGASVSWLHPQAPLAYAWFGSDMAFTRSAGDGSFRLPKPELPSRLVAMHAAYAAGVVSLDADARKGSITIPLPDGMEVDGIVVDSSDKPVAGAGVVLIEDAAGAVPLPLDAALASGQLRPWVESGADGKFRLHLNAKPHDLVVAKTGYAAFRTEMTPGEKPLRAVLARGVSIQGRVVRQDGTPLGQAMAYVRGDDGTTGSAMVGQDGAFVFTSLAAGEYSLGVRTDGGSVDERRVKAPSSDVLIELDPLATVRLTVTDKETGLPIAYSVYAGDTFREVEAQPGPYTLQIGAGSAEVSVESEGYVPASREIVADIAKPVDVALALIRGRTIRGRVVNAAGAPIAEAHVQSANDDFGRGDSTSAEGEFQVDGAPPQDLSLSFTATGYVGKTVDIPRDQNDPLTVVLSKGRAIAGRVVTEAGQPVEGATITTSSAAHDAESQSATSAADGTFRVEGLADARHALRAAKTGYRDAELRDVDLNAPTPIVLTLRGQGLTGTIHGKVDGFAGGSWLYGGIMVRGEDDSSASAQGEIRRDGTYRVENVPSGEVEVRATAGNAHGGNATIRETATVPAGGDVEVNLSFNNDTVVRGTVTANGQPQPGRSVAFIGRPGSTRTVTDAHGVYEVSGLEPDRYTVTVTIGARVFSTSYLLTGDSGTFDIDATFGRIEGRVVDTDGVAIADAAIEAQPVSGVSFPDDTVKSDAAGSFVAEVAAGTYNVHVTRKGFASVTERVETNGAPMLVRMVRSDGIRVRLLDARDGATLGGYVVATDSKNVQLGRVHEQERDGAMTLALAPGSYRISVSADGYASQTVQASLPSTTELRIPLTPGGTLIIRTDRDSNDLVKLVQPNGTEYVRCHCNGIAEIRLTGKTTTVEHIAPGSYTMQVINAQGKTIARYPVAIAEGGTAVAEVRLE